MRESCPHRRPSPVRVHRTGRKTCDGRELNPQESSCFHDRLNGHEQCPWVDLNHQTSQHLPFPPDSPLFSFMLRGNILRH